MTCEQCDEQRAMSHPNRVGQPCDICDGRGYDYLGRSCRHCSSDGPEPTVTDSTDA